MSGSTLTERQRQVLAVLDRAGALLSVAGICGNMTAHYGYAPRSRGGLVSVLRTLRRRGLIGVAGGGTAWCQPGRAGSKQRITKAGRSALEEVA